MLFLLTLNFFAAENTFIEMVAGSLKVKGEKVGVLTTTIFSNNYKPGMKSVTPPDDPLANGIKLELINKGASVMILNPPGMEQIVSDFIEIRKGQFSTKEVLASDAATSFSNGMKNAKAEITSGIQLIEKLLDINEFSGEIDRINNYANVYKRIVELWGITKLITVTRINQFSVIVKGYEINSASASLVFQYEVRANKDNWNKIPQWKEEWKISGGFGFTVEDTSGIKYEQSYKRVVELIKRVSEFLK